MKEFNNRTAGSPERTYKNCAITRSPGSFQKKTAYVDDAYERREDMRKLDYQRRAALILDKSSSFRSSVKQRGPFEALRKTYGTDKFFPEKYIPQNPKESYGAFRIGDLAKQGHNSTLGVTPKYIEDPIEDKVLFQKDIKKPIWKDPKHVTTTCWNP
jgi:hypothetical protein